MDDRELNYRQRIVTAQMKRCPLCGANDVYTKYGIDNEYPQLGDIVFVCRKCHGKSNYLIVGNMCKVAYATPNYVAGDFTC